MCRCNSENKTPFCGKPGCEPPKLSRREQLRIQIENAEAALEGDRKALASAKRSIELTEIEMVRLKDELISLEGFTSDEQLMLASEAGCMLEFSNNESFLAISVEQLRGMTSDNTPKLYITEHNNSWTYCRLIQMPGMLTMHFGTKKPHWVDDNAFVVCKENHGMRITQARFTDWASMTTKPFIVWRND